MWFLRPEKQKSGGTDTDQFCRMPPLNPSDRMAPALIWGKDSTHRKKGEYRQMLRENHLGGPSFRRLQHNLCLFFPWEPCAYTLAVQSH